MSDKFRRNGGVFCVLTFSALIFLLLSSVCPAVNSKITRQSTSADLLKGKTQKLVIGSRGTIQLGRSAEVLVEEFEDVWSINSIAISGGTIYAGTSPNGGIYKYTLGKLTKIYPAESEKEPDKEPEKEPDEKPDEEPDKEPDKEPDEEPDDANKPSDANTVEAEEHLSNEHIFAMAMDLAGRLLAGISGNECKLYRFEADKMEVVFEPNDAKYIFAIEIDTSGNIYLGTGPEGKIYGSDPFGKKTKVVYDSPDKNILSLAAAQNSFIYAGSDSRGLVYRINPHRKKATVLYDSDQPEITALLFKKDGDLIAAATSAKIVQTQTQFAAQSPAGRPESKATNSKNTDQSKGGRKLEIPNTKKPGGSKPSPSAAPIRKGSKPGKASHIYKVSGDGYVTDIFSETAVFLCLAEQEGKLLVGTGNNAQLFTVDPDSEEQAVIYEDEQAVQITAIAASGEDVYIGTANPAKLIRVSKNFASEGTYTSDLIDAGQPAKWGKLQIEADIPTECKVLVASRSGNVNDINDPTFSEWTELVEVTAPVQLQCPLGRFCQYKLVLQSKSGDKSPLIREVAVASSVPNLAPKVASVTVSRVTTAGKQGFFKISYKAEDDNNDKLIYKVDFRKVGRTNWIELKDELEAESLEWAGNTVEDDRYEVRVTASDERSNTTATKLQGSRVSEPVVVDNTGPVVGDVKTTLLVEKDEQYNTFEFKVADQLSAIGKVEYTIDSNADWIGTLPDDSVYDTTEEAFTIKVDAKEYLPKGDHVLTIKAGDAVGNITYKTLEVNIDQ